MRRAVLLIALAACELQPAPKKQAAPVEVVPPQPAQPPVAPPQPLQPGVVADAGVDGPSPQTIQAGEACIKVASHVVQVFIDTAKDPAQAAIYEQERMKMTKATAEACERQAWGAEAMKCYLLAKDPKTIKACENKFPPVPPPKMGGDAGAGAGSAGAPAGASAGSAQPKGPGVVQPKAAQPGAGAGSAAQPKAPGVVQPKAAQPGAGGGSAQPKTAQPKSAGSAAH